MRTTNEIEVTIGRAGTYELNLEHFTEAIRAVRESGEATWLVINGLRIAAIAPVELVR